MKKSIIKIIAIIAIISIAFVYRGDIASFFKGPTTYAVGDLFVDWGVAEGQPIFTIANMAPGDDEQRTVMVENDASQTRPVGVRGIKTSETGNLANTFDFIIKHNGADVYGGTSPTGSKTLQEFFDDSAGPDGIFLTNLAAGANTNFTFLAIFKPESGNEFQQKQVVFDLKIGISIPTPQECAQNNLNGDVLFGTQNQDILRGTENGDLIFAFEGNDVVLGRGGDDCIVGGAGRDSLLGETGADTLLGNDGDDSLVGGLGNDRIFGNANADSISADQGDDMIEGGDGVDSISAGDGNDSVFAGAGNDSISGGFGNDFLDGQAGTDSGSGGAGVDTCRSVEFKASCEL